MAKARIPRAPDIRFKVEPAYAPPEKIARRLGLSDDEFRQVGPALFAEGFPAPDSTTGKFCIESVEIWSGRYPETLARFGAKLTGDALPVVMRDWKPPRDVPAGIIYVVGFGNYVKIGFTAGPLPYRVRALQTACPEKLTVYATLKGDRAAETALHSRFAAHRAEGEWFRREGALAEWIEGGCRK